MPTSRCLGSAQLGFFTNEPILSSFFNNTILDYLLKRKVNLSHRKQAAHTSQLKQEKDEETERLTLQKARELDTFDQQNHGALPQYSDKHFNRDRNEFHGANSVKTTSFEEEALRTTKAFWLPSATPDAPVKVNAPTTSTTCPEGKEKLKMKSLFSIHFTEDKNDEKKPSSLDKTYVCPSCKATLTNTLSLLGLSSCGHVFCKKCADKFMAVDKVCLVCNKACKDRNLINLEKGGTGFAGHGDNLEAKDFKHLGSGSGLGLVRPATKT
ncbi:putative nitric oxide synthase-interacting protein [Helianthus annuus]|nr:putative nitric oxide synthase-interacting protein [Helianthus annuus]